jgi:hypothetical protein
MPKFENIDPQRGHDLDRRSFFRSTGTIAAAMVTGGISFSAINDRELFLRAWVRMGHLACKHLGNFPDFA